MKVTWAWLQDWVELPPTPEELAHALAMRGFPVASIEKGVSLDPAIVVGRVLEAPGRLVLLVRAKNRLDLDAYRRPAPSAPAEAAAEQWFVENTYHADEFKVNAATRPV